MVVRFDFRTGDCGALHSHPHVQSTFVQSGRYRFTVDGRESEVGPGDAFIIPSRPHVDGEEFNRSVHRVRSWSAKRVQSVSP